MNNKNSSLKFWFVNYKNFLLYILPEHFEITFILLKTGLLHVVVKYKTSQKVVIAMFIFG